MSQQPPIKCIALLSGGLDSMLAIRIMQEQGIEVEAVNFKTAFTCCQDTSAQVAHKLGVRLTVLTQDDDYLKLIAQPRFGYGKGANPCVDCRIYMFDKATEFMRQVGAKFMVSGEVVGQRPMSQKKQDLKVISHHSICNDTLLRPLSAKCLPPTLPEREGWVDREQLYDFVGRGRKGLIALAKELGIEEIPSPSTGCSLTEVRFSKKVFDLIQLKPDANRWEYDLLSIGRHFRLDDATKVIVGRDESENLRLRYLHSLPEAASSATLHPLGFQGATAMVVGDLTSHSREFAVGLVVRYSKDPYDGALLELNHCGEISQVKAAECQASNAALTIAQQ